MSIRLAPILTLLVLLLGTAGCAESADDGEVVTLSEEAPDEGATDPAGDAMRERVLEDELAESAVLPQVLAGAWRSEVPEAFLDFERRRYAGPGPEGDAIEGGLRILEEGEDYVTFEVGGAHTLTARLTDDDRLVITTGGEEGVTLQRER